MTHSLFISDLHLPVAASPLREAFARFLAGPARSADAVYILGDLFEHWVGDDAGLTDYAAEIENLRALTASGVPVYFQAGNRDFLIHRNFFSKTGVQPLPDPCRLDFYGTPTLISHGDIFCTDDVSYQRWRRFARRRPVQWLYLRLPVALRRRIAGRLRAQSSRKKRLPQDILDVNEDAILDAFRVHRVPRLIHGHTHRPHDHHYEVDQGVCERHVLADWEPGRCEALEVSSAGVRRLPLDG